jgi:hypothetical protein
MRDRGFLSDAEHKELERKLVELQRMLTSLVTAVQESVVAQSPRAKRGQARGQEPVASGFLNVLASKQDQNNIVKITRHRRIASQGENHQ